MTETSMTVQRKRSVNAMTVSVGCILGQGTV